MPGATGEYGYQVIKDKVEVHDLQAAMLRILRMDHTQLTYRFGGCDMRLTDMRYRIISYIS